MTVTSKASDGHLTAIFLKAYFTSPSTRFYNNFFSEIDCCHGDLYQLDHRFMTSDAIAVKNILAHYTSNQGNVKRRVKFSQLF